MFVLVPDAKNMKELSSMGLNLSDLPLFSFQREAVFLGEHIDSEKGAAQKLDKISKQLEQHEKKLSVALLDQMLPRKVADELRNGRTPQPEAFPEVTIFFSDVVEFTTISSHLPPHGVVTLLNNLYIVMDRVAERFGVYKVETIGDAYMVCAGLPTANKNHALEIANFAVAVREAVKEVSNPLDNSPIQLRIGIHTGPVVAGVVGNLMPRYCLFGDAVNTASRHESTGEAGKIHCSKTTHSALTGNKVWLRWFKFSPRGFVDMKGKGQLMTYWLEGALDENEFANPGIVEDICKECRELLAKNALASAKARTRRYELFRERGGKVSSIDEDELLGSGGIDEGEEGEGSGGEEGKSDVWKGYSSLKG
jgi:class 3 adenylate cyclase